VTQAEHEEAIITYLDCIRGAGFSNVSVVRARSGMIASLAVADPGDSAPAVLRCQASFYTYAREGFRDTTWDPGGSERQQLRNLVACMRDHGIIELPKAADSIVAIEAVVDEVAATDHEDTRNAKGAFAECQTRWIW
jgi:hypothetical protein